MFASNYLVTVLDAALRAYQAAGIPEPVARELAQPLVTEAVANVFRLGAAPALSGPIARGDSATVQRQLQAVQQWDAATRRTVPGPGGAHARPGPAQARGMTQAACTPLRPLVSPDTARCRRVKKDRFAFLWPVLGQVLQWC